MSAPVVVAEIIRSGFVEGRHYGSVVALATDGSLDWSIGDASSQVLPRSCNKPLQAVAMVREGLDLPPDLLALASASHSGEDFHLEGVRRIPERAGLDESALQNPADYPMEPAVRDAVLRAGGGPTRLQMNCSGKHAAMLLTCVINGWDTDTYLSPDHPVQTAIARLFAELTGEPIEVVAVDGCGAPLLSTSLTGLARAFRRLALCDIGPGHQVAEAIRQYPEYVAGTNRDERALLAAIPGAIGKMGAEACQVIALADGRAFAIKIDDGSDRARPVVISAALTRSGVDSEQGADASTLTQAGRHLLLGGEAVVGVIRATF